MSDIVHWLRKLAALVEADHAPQHVVMHMRAGADEIERLRADNERLRAALEDVVQEATEHHAENVSRAELGGSDMAQRKAKAIVSRSGVLLYKIRFIARAALGFTPVPDGQPALGKVEPRTDSRYNNAERIFGDD